MNNVIPIRSEDEDDAKDLLSRALCRRYSVVPLSLEVINRPGKKASHVLQLGMVQPTDVRAIKTIVDAAQVDDVDALPMTAIALGKKIEETYPFLVPKKSSSKALAQLTRKSARRFDAIPLAVKDGYLYVGVVDPYDAPNLDQIIKEARMPLDAVQLPRDEIVRRIAEAYPETVSNVGVGQTAELLDDIFSAAVRRRASDIHIESNSSEVLLSIDGNLTTYRTLSTAQVSALIESLMNAAEIVASGNKMIGHDGSLRRDVDGRTIDVRLATIPTVTGTSLVMRIGGHADLIRSLEENGMRGPVLSRYRRIMNYPDGLILVTGPIAHGKSSTIQSTLKEIYTPTRSYRSAENPVETKLPWLGQTQIDRNGKLTFAQCIQQFIRMNTHVMFIGEIRDEETLTEAISASLLGHLLFSTLHAGSAPRAIRRLTNRGASADDIASALIGIVAQRIIPTLCVICKESAPLPKSLLALVKDRPQFAEALAKERFHVPVGCEHCDQTGYQGRIGIFEVLEVTDKVSDAIVAQSTAHVLAEADAGYEPMVIDGIRRVLEGVTSISQLKLVTRWPFEESGEDDGVVDG